MNKEKLTKDSCIALLRERAEQLGRLPVKSDFSQEQVVAVKAFLGPWPRALESAGLKPVNPAVESRRLEKKIRHKKALTEKKLGKGSLSENDG